MPILLLPRAPPTVRPPTGGVTLNRDSQQAVGLVAWYPGMALVDVAEFARVGPYRMTKTGAVWVFDTEHGDVLDLNGTSDHAEVTASPVANVPCTIVAWFKKDSTAAAAWVASLYDNADSTEALALLARATGEVRARYDGTLATVNADDTAGYSAGVWAHAAAIFGSVTHRAVKVGGRSRVTGATTDAGAVTLNSIAIGWEAMFNRSWFDGLVGDVRIYARALADEELEQQYNPATRRDLYYELGKRSYYFFHLAGGLAASATIGESTASGLSGTGAGTGAAPSTATIAAATAAALDATAAGVGSASVTATIAAATAAALDATVAGVGTAAATATIAAATVSAIDASVSGAGTAVATTTIAAAATAALGATATGTGTSAVAATIAAATVSALDASAANQGGLSASATIAESTASGLSGTAVGSGTAPASANIAIAAASALNATALGSGTAAATATLSTATASALNAVASIGTLFANAEISLGSITSLGASASGTSIGGAAATMAAAAVSAFSSAAVGVGVASVGAIVSLATVTALSALVSILRTLHVIDFVLQRTAVIDFHVKLVHRLDFEM